MIYELPPQLNSSKDLPALRDYLVRLAQSLEQSGAAAAASVTVTSAAKGKKNDTQTASEKDIQTLTDQAAALKALIVKNARLQAADKAELEQSIDSIEGTTLLHIDSSRGTLFKHSAVSTELRAVLYRGGQRITDIEALREAFGPAARLQWSAQRMGEQNYIVISAADARLSDHGFTLTLSPADVDVKVTFTCELITE